MGFSLQKRNLLPKVILRNGIYTNEQGTSESKMQKLEFKWNNKIFLMNILYFFLSKIFKQMHVLVYFCLKMIYNR